MSGGRVTAGVPRVAVGQLVMLAVAFSSLVSESASCQMTGHGKHNHVVSCRA